jgi:predicted outer membrane repeat protein
MRSVLISLLVLTATIASAQTSLYVDSSVTSSGTGASWATAYKTLGEALNVANSASTLNAYNIYIAKGTYYPTGVQSGTNRDSTFRLLRGGLRVYGGYPNGGGTKDISAYPTILSGAIGSVTDSNDNSYHVIVTTNVSSTGDSIVLDGLRIVRGRANGNGSKLYNGVNVNNEYGAGIYMANLFNKLLIKDCQFTSNSASTNGGAMFASDAGPAIIGGTFALNSSGGYGGAIYAGGSNITPAVQFINSSFTGNYTVVGGGAIYLLGFPLNISGCAFSGNATSTIYPTTSNGGAILMSGVSATANNKIRNCDFTGNSAVNGGAVAVNSVATSTVAINVDTCTFTANKSVSGSLGGGAIYHNAGNLMSTGCSYSNNKAVTGQGGAIWTSASATIINSSFANDSSSAEGGAICSSGTLSISSSTITGNYSALNGGGIFGNAGAASLTNCTINNNTTAGNGGGIYKSYSSATLTNCTVNGNIALGNGGGIYSQSSSTINSSRLQGNSAAVNGGGTYTIGGSITSSVLSGNRATTSGGGVYINSGFAVTITNCTLAGDSALYGNGIYSGASSSVTLSNSIVWESIANSVFTATNGTITASNSTIQGGFTGTGNNSSNPAFVSPSPASSAPTASGNYALSPCSPAINTGVNSGSYAGLLDAAGNPRLVDVTVDRGAYEFQPTSVAGIISGATSLCAGATSQFTSSVAGGTWSNPGPVLATVNITGLVTGVNAGIDTILYTVVSNGCAVTATRILTVNPIPYVAPITGISAVCSGGGSTLSNASPIAGVWSSSNTAVATINNFGMVVSASSGSGTTTIKYKVTSAGCSDSTTLLFTVTAPPTVAPITAPSSNICTGTAGAVQMSNSTTGGIWSKSCNNNYLSLTTTGLATGLQAGSCTIYYTVTGPTSCSTTVSYPVTISTTPAMPLVNGPAALCVGSTASYTTTAPAGGIWTVGNIATGPVSGTGVLTGTAAGNTSVIYSYTASNGCSASGAKGVTVIAPVTKNIIGWLCAGTAYIFGSQILTTPGIYSNTFTGPTGCDSTVNLTLMDGTLDTSVTQTGAQLQANATGVSYQWVRCEGAGLQTPIAGQTGQTFIATANGSYAVNISNGSCATLSSCFNVTGLAVGTTARQAWSIFPNPTSGIVTVSTGSITPYGISIWDATGKRLDIIKPQTATTNIHLEEYPTGLYWISVSDEHGTSQVFPVLLTSAH